jgi:hypothetical protein
VSSQAGTNAATARRSRAVKVVLDLVVVVMSAHFLDAVALGRPGLE